MAKKAKLFDHKERKSRAEVSQFLAQLSQKINEGQVILRAEPSDVVLPIPQHMSMKVKAREKIKRVKGKRQKLTLTLSWYEGDHQDGPLSLG